MPLSSFFHILNPSRRHRASVEKFIKGRPELNAIFIEKKSHPTHLESVIEWIVREKYENIAVWGGDGTLSRAVQALYQFKALGKLRLALIPTGTCNDFARALNLPAWPHTKTRFKAEPEYRDMDLGLLETEGVKRIFVNNAGFGRTLPAVGKKRSHPFFDILNFSTKKIDLEWENGNGRHFETKDIILGVVFNAPYFNGAMHFKKDVDPSDGQLNAFFEPPQNRLRLIGKFIKSWWGRPLRSANTLEVDSQFLRLATDQELYPQADGERITPTGVRSLQFSILPKALRMAVWK